MNQLKSILVFSMLFVSLFVGIIGYSGPASADIQGNWVEEIIRDVPTTVRGIALGDVNGDGKNEVVVGLGNTNSEIRMYEKENGIWKETLIDDTPVGVTDLVVGDADNDGVSEIVCSLASGSNEVRMYDYSNGSWGYETVTTAPSGISDLDLGDADNDGWNEVVIAISNATTNDVRAYQKSGVWVEENITDAPFQVSVLTLGDADNDGNIEVVIGMTGNFPPPFTVYVPNEVRAYEKVGGNWIEDNITNTPDDDIISLVIGDHDGDGLNEVGFSTGDSDENSEFFTYEKKGTWSLELQYPAAPDNFFFMGGVGDTDNDGINEFVTMEAQFMGSGKSNMIVWENMSYLYTGNAVRGSLPSRAKIVIGDGDNDGTTEIICGFISTSYEVRSYSNDRGKIRFTSHYDGEYVTGTEIIDVLVTSNFVDAVRFYIDDNLTFTDTKYPYQLILDTSTLVEDATYEIKAEGVRIGNGPLVATIDLRVNNLVPVGDYISVSTLNAVYAPDEDVSVLIGIKSPPSFSYLNLDVSYVDPGGNTLYSISEMLPFSNQYMLVLPLGSDADKGSYTVTVNAYGISQDTLMWSDSNSTTFDVAGRSIHEQLDEINASMPDVNITELLDSIEYLNQTINPKMDNLTLQLTGVNDTLRDRLKNLEGNLLGDLANVNASFTSDIQNLLILITDVITGLNESLSEELTSILENITTGNDALQTWLDTVLTQIDANITDTKNSLENQLTALETTTQTFYDDILVDLSEVFNWLAMIEGNLSSQHMVISNAIDNLNSTIADAPGLSTGDIVDRINNSIAILEDLDSNMTSHDTDIENALNQLMFLVANEGNMTRDQLIQNVSEIMGQMQDLDTEIVSHDDEVKGNLSTIEDLISNIGAMDISDIMRALTDLEGNLTQIDNDMAQDVADIGYDVEDFQTDMEDRLAVINATLKDLETLEDIVADLEALNTNIDEMEDEINEIPTEKEEGIGSELTLMLVLMFIVMLIVMIMGFLMKKMGGKAGMGDHASMMSMPMDEKKEIIDEDEGEGGWGEPEEELEEEEPGEDLEEGDKEGEIEEEEYQ